MVGLVHVIDDDASFRAAVERRLKLAGYDVETYSSAQQLLDRLPDAEMPGCILLDVQMPGLSGLELQSRGFPDQAGIVRTTDRRDRARHGALPGRT